MKGIFKIYLFILLVFTSFISVSQNSRILNDCADIKLTIIEDSIQINIKNESDKSIFLPIDRVITQNSSVNSIIIEFGIDLQVFYERGVFELEELKPNESKTYSNTLINRDYNNIHFSYQFYMRKFENKNNKKIYNTDFIYDKKWLKKGDWEWSEIIIDLKK